MKDLFLSKEQRKKLGKPDFFQPVIVAYKFPRSQINKWSYKIIDDEEIKNELRGILCKITQTFNNGKEIELPRIAVFDTEIQNDSSKLPYAAYESQTETIIINLGIADQLDEEFLLIHEMCHHYICKMNNENKKGFVYVHNGYIFGNMFDEGYTNFFTEQVCNKKDKLVYIFPSFIAKEHANIIEKKAANRLYASSAISVIREDFNKKLKKYYPIQKYRLDNTRGCFIELTPFEIFCGNLEYAGRFWESTNNVFAEKMRRAAKCVIEMMNYYALLTDTTDFRAYRVEQEKFFEIYGRYLEI